MNRTRLLINCVIGGCLLLAGLRLLYIGYYSKTGDIADIYAQKLGWGLTVLAATGLLTLWLRFVKRR